MPLIEATLLHSVVLAGGRTPVRVVARGFGFLRVGDVRKLVLGSFDGIVLPLAAAQIEVSFGRTQRALDASVVPAPQTSPVSVEVSTPAPALDIPRPMFDIAVQLREAPRD